MPIGLALISCDTIIEDKLSGKKSLIGIFGELNAEKFPCVHPSMFLMVSMTGGTGEYQCEVVVTDSSQEEKVFSARGKIKFDDPNQVMDMVLLLQNIRFPAPDIYWIKVSIDDIPLMMRPLILNQKNFQRPQQG